jgi:Xanthine/uracil permeases
MACRPGGFDDDSWAAWLVAGAVYGAMSVIIRRRGTEIIMRLLPPIVTGPVIIVIGT